jgi:hypothetical protein
MDGMEGVDLNKLRAGAEGGMPSQEEVQQQKAQVSD